MVKFAVIGTSKITDRFIEAAKLCKNFELTAVYSRTKERALEYASRYEAALAYDDLDELAESREVDAVYIASPNSFHAFQSIKMLRGKKHVLCEKTIASNKKELEQMIKASKENGVILLEAMRSIFDPGFRAIENNLIKLGTIRRITFQYCQYSSRYDNFKKGIVENAFNPVFSNGALMDIGVYCIHPLVKLFGMPKSIWASSVILKNGVDGAGTIMVNYENMQGELLYSKITNSKLPSQIQGEKGCMIIKEIPDTRQVTIIYNNGKKEYININKYDNNMYYEVEELIRLIQIKENADEYNKCSLMELSIMDEARRKMGIKFPADV
ncbi:glucose--fructose oxidoreductase precursor [Clostridium ragsdalei P11]|uniref:Glucose--fructose oxidoreductase n=1 Tax=Clostridium ragsdalei P11 TaxID=1353534 RepID=A0A1A6B2N4_9CLOT|nr:Gfo/Idh/MocA family oxidoreductase [Clostridium ragsdalei]OBR96543.1 glucose--fructose oxidoreductase precursor [Clostridium ragsdalei P11]